MAVLASLEPNGQSTSALPVHQSILWTTIHQEERSMNDNVNIAYTDLREWIAEAEKLGEVGL